MIARPITAAPPPRAYIELFLVSHVSCTLSSSNFLPHLYFFGVENVPSCNIPIVTANSEIVGSHVEYYDSCHSDKLNK